MRTLAMALISLFSLVVSGLFIAGQWLATTYSLSEKLVGTAVILLFTVPVTAFLLFWAHEGFDE